VNGIHDQLAALMREALEVAKPEAELVRNAFGPEARRAANLRDADVEGVLLPEDVNALVKGQLRLTPSLESVHKWHNARSTGLRGAGAVMVLLGGCGRGKTIAAAWLLAEIGGRYMTSEQLRRTMQSARRDDFEKLLLGTRVLVLDDVGVEGDVASAEIAVFETVNRRLGLPRGWTLITSNMAWRDFGTRFGERVVSRLEHAAHVVSVEGPSLRRRRVSP
jgi:DNA replication protein DnaC